MSKLYPIGTQLITRRLSQAALYVELFPNSRTEFASFFDPDDEVDERHLVGFCLSADEWRVMVTAENQKWLSPVPMVGDFVWIENMGMGFEIGTIADNVVFKSAHKSPFADTESGHSVSNFYCSIEDNPKIISRIYPNGQRAPMLEWDEVIEQAVGERK